MFTVHTIDLEWRGAERSIAAHLVVGPEGPVLIETGPGSTVATLVEKLAVLGFAPEDVRSVLVTHIHLDHAGAAGWWAQRGAQIHVHARGARHLVAPERLVASARRIYGDQVDRLWGAIDPVPADRVTAVHDGDSIRAGGLEFTAIETPGHAAHHHAYALDDVCLTGDAAGIVSPEGDHIMVPTPPPEFDLPAWRRTIETLRARRFRRLYPTHFGVVDDPTRHLDRLARHLEEHVEMVRGEQEGGAETEAIVERYTAFCRAQAREQGVTRRTMPQHCSANLLRMNVTGILRWLDREGASAGVPAGDAAAP